MYSFYFKALSHNWDDLPEEDGLPLLKMDNFESHVFSDILCIIYPNVPSSFPKNHRNITSDHLRLVDYLSLEIVLIIYEEWLSEDKKNYIASRCQKLLWSEQFAMSMLQVHCGLSLRSNKKFSGKRPLTAEGSTGCEEIGRGSAVRRAFQGTRAPRFEETSYS